MTRIDPKLASKIENSPVQCILAILDKLFSSAPQPRVNTEAARSCGELLGRHLLNLLRSCGELNLMGFHSSAISLFRPLEDALDCLAAVTIIAGTAVTCPPNLGPGDMLEFDLDERRRNGQETLHSRTNHRHTSGG